MHCDLLFGFANFSPLVYVVLAQNTLKFQWDTGSDVNVMLVTLHVAALEVTISLNVRTINLESCRCKDTKILRMTVLVY